MTTAHRRHHPLAGAATVLALGLALAGCSAGTGDNDAGVPANPHGITADSPSGSATPAAGSGASGGAPASGSVSGTPTDPEAADARADQRAVGAAAERAASFGFTGQVPATDAEIATTREDARLRQTNTSGTTVDPAECKAPLTAVDWSPILMPQADASRIDFGSGTFAGTGTVEAATLEDATVVDDHLASVERLVADCPGLTMTVTDSNQQTSAFDFTARVSDADSEQVDSGLVWTRTAADSGDASAGAETTAQVLIGQTEDHVVMVSFIGGSEVSGEEFTTMAEQILAAAVGAL